MAATAKECTKCKITKPLEAFCRCKQAKDGLSNSCRECNAKSRRRYEAGISAKGYTKSNDGKKVCRVCHVRMDCGKFHPSKRHADGLTTACRSCTLNAVKASAKRNYSSPTDGKKRCNQCRQEQPVANFHRSSTSRDGLSSQCKLCNRNYRLARQKQYLTDGFRPLSRGKKVCPRCKTEKPAVSFRKCKGRSDGLTCWCKPCISENNKSVNKRIAERGGYPRSDSDKSCKDCGTVKPASEFGRNKYSKDGLMPSCVSCSKEKGRESAAKRKLQPKQPLVNGRKTCSWCGVSKDAKGFSRHCNSSDGYRSHCKDCVRRKNREKKETINASARKNRARRIKEDVGFRLFETVRARLKSLLTTIAGGKAAGKRSGGDAVRDLGCTTQELKVHLEKQFKPGMTWENWSRETWHVDHIFPLAKADLADDAEFLAACNWRNLQPLWAKENMQKGDKVTLAARRLFNKLCKEFADAAAAEQRGAA